uniref:Uncharacterized protein n=1 Tax=Klebsiella pneumoniae TaxID=573 RepID=A0A8B0SU64_KLEPN|nr:hypothetical protein [Klebsiella pneumoniae]
MAGRRRCWGKSAAYCFSRVGMLGDPRFIEIVTDALSWAMAHF